jgi:hypothetical protein
VLELEPVESRISFGAQTQARFCQALRSASLGSVW